jgi:[glutamine synthetase] adenylyltransferase / [glutamine synthetase]-adenylyl-L-tyrosine phosphorylase
MNKAMKKDVKNKMRAFSKEVGNQTVEDFMTFMDEDYFSLYSPKEIYAHMKMSIALDPEHPVQCKVTPQGNGKFDIVIVAFDYFSEFSIICGLLASYGFDIYSGNVYTFSTKKPEGRRLAHRQVRRGIKRGPSGSFTMKIVDVFSARLQKGLTFSSTRRKEFEKELQTFIRLLSEGLYQEARERLNRYLVERLGGMKGITAGLLFPIEIRLDNLFSSKWTVLDVHSKDAPAFLYTLSNALSLRNIYIHKVEIRSIGTEVRDRFFISDREGHKIIGEKEQKVLRMAVVLIKQFSSYLFQAPDPAKAMRYFDQFLDKVMEEGTTGHAITFLKEKEGLHILAQLLGTSDFLWEDFLRMQFENLMPIIEDFKRREMIPRKDSIRRELATRLARGRTWEDEKKTLNEFKDREMFLVDMKRILDSRVTLMDFSKVLTNLTEVVLDQAYTISHRYFMKKYGRPLLKNGKECSFTICGLGKFGGREMGYASDIELLLCYGGDGRTRGKHSIENGEYFEQLARELTELIEARQEGIFHIDLRLRPYGKAGPLANSLDQFRDYYRSGGEAAPFERQALTKLRWVAGDTLLGRRIEALRDHFVYSGEPWDLETALHLRRRQVQELVMPGKINVKYSPGGIIDIEYAVQYLQIQYGKDHPTLRTPATLEALKELCRLRIISQKDFNQLQEAYIFLRTLIDALRIVRGNARDLILPEEKSDESKFLARRLDYLEKNWAKAAEKLDQDIRFQMKTVNRFFVNRFVPHGKARRTYRLETGR